jgi:hypothetical protein
MPQTAENPAEGFRMVSEQLMEMRAEILAARILAIHALQLALTTTAEPAVSFATTYAAAMESVTKLTKAKVDDPDSLLEPIVNGATRHVESAFEELKRVLGLRPAAN